MIPGGPGAAPTTQRSRSALADSSAVHTRVLQCFRVVGVLAKDSQEGVGSAGSKGPGEVASARTKRFLPSGPGVGVSVCCGGDSTFAICSGVVANFIWKTAADGF